MWFSRVQRVLAPGRYTKQSCFQSDGTEGSNSIHTPSPSSQRCPLCDPSWGTCWWRWVAPDQRGSGTLWGASFHSSLWGKKRDASSAPKMHQSYLLKTSAAFERSNWNQAETWRRWRRRRRIPLQYCRTVSMAHFLSESQRIRAEPVLSLSCGHQPCHKYTSWWLSTRNRAKHQTERTTQGHHLKTITVAHQLLYVATWCVGESQQYNLSWNKIAHYILPQSLHGGCTIEMQSTLSTHSLQSQHCLILLISKPSNRKYSLYCNNKMLL